MIKSVYKIMTFFLMSLLFISSHAQQVNDILPKKETKPYKILTSGKQITIKSTKELKHVMLWTNSGDRLVEQKEINANSYSFRIPINGRFFYLMVGLTNGKIYTEKIGLRD